MKAYQDPDHDGNSLKYLSGETCIEQGCVLPAGTAWSHLWCMHHNVERMDRISRSLEMMQLQGIIKSIHAAGGVRGQ